METCTACRNPLSRTSHFCSHCGAVNANLSPNELFNITQRIEQNRATPEDLRFMQALAEARKQLQSPPRPKLPILWLIIAIPAIWIIFHPSTDNLIAVGSILASSYFLFHNYITGRIRLTFRASLYIWLLLLFSIGWVLGLTR